ncbi:zinc finger protein ZPR1 [Caerostris extrusa]|uniref:Zinc finger protein ZPR1 n=1 Tax=Caerostris extrusa TaxID=172846 RepID=A0AAV4R7V3_CAEEX|nr:zinc finger protein ZPR1 [Caerostris extrusa]
MTSANEKPMFRDLNADNDPEVTEIESLCLRCQKNGITKLLLTKIPFYKEVVLMSFSCDHCNWENNELQPASKIQEKGVIYKLKVENSKDLARVVVKTEWASITIPELEFEIPAHSQEGTVTNVEGIIARACSNLHSTLAYLKKEDPDSAGKIEEFIEKMTKLKSGESPFYINSFLENFNAPLPDPQLEVSYFDQSLEEIRMLGLQVPEDSENATSSVQLKEEDEDLREEVLGLPTNCYSCNAPCTTNMKITHILLLLSYIY